MSNTRLFRLPNFALIVGNRTFERQTSSITDVSIFVQRSFRFPFCDFFDYRTIFHYGKAYYPLFNIQTMLLCRNQYCSPLSPTSIIITEERKKRNDHKLATPAYIGNDLDTATNYKSKNVAIGCRFKEVKS